MTSHARIAVAAAILAGAVRLSMADDLTGYVEMSGTRSSTSTDICGFAVTETSTTSLRPRANVLWSRRIWPYVTAQAGVLYERFDDRIEQSGFGQDTEMTRFRPFARLTLRSPV